MSLWDLTGNKIASFVSGPRQSVAFSPDGRRLLCTPWFGNARLFACRTTQELIDRAREVAPRQLTTDQRERFFVNTDR